VTIRDVLVGEVWVGSGQSNMEFLMEMTHDAKRTLPQAKDSKIRLFKQKLLLSTKPLDTPAGEWKVCTPETVKDFSAVAYHFGLNLRKKLGVPVGLIDSCWGGSFIESWMTGESLKGEAAFKPMLKRWDKKPAWEKKMWAQGGFNTDFWVSGLRLMPRDSSREPVTVSFDAVTVMPEPSNVPGAWSTGVKDGSAITITRSDEKGPAPGALGHIAGRFLPDAWGWVTTALGEKGKPADLSDFEAVEFYGKGDGKYIFFVSLPSITDWDNYRTPKPFTVGKKWKKYRIPFSSLKQSGWGKAKPFTSEAVQNVFFGLDPQPLSEIPSQLYNAMIHPFVPFPIRGVIWYQGEQNTERPQEYHRLLAGLIGGWRKAWGDEEMPFIFAQLPNFMAVQPEPSESQWAELREQQLQTLDVPNTGMAVLIDVGEANDIHPKNKTDVGYRMAQAALHTAYGVKGAQLSPLYDSMALEGKNIRVSFKNADEGLKTKDGGPVKGFAIAGEDGKFQWAKAKIEKGTVIVWNDEIAEPKAVRYAWGDNPVCNLLGRNELPVSPFRAEVEEEEPE
jgi:sialate O-acetylesterase